MERTTLYRKLKKGEISAQSDASSNKFIEASELLRVYPNADISEDFATVDQQLQESGFQQHATVTTNQLLQREIEVRNEKIRDLEQERERERRDAQATIDDLRRRLDQEAEERRRLTLMLTDQRSKAVRKPWRKRLVWAGWMTASALVVLVTGAIVFRESLIPFFHR